MNDIEIQDFVSRFAAAWAARDGDAFLALWHADGLLHTPLVNRPIKGSELGKLNAFQKEAAPDLVWQLLDWSARGDTVVIEWQTSRIIKGQRFDWRGVDKFRLQDGKIMEERVYTDTALLRALRTLGEGADFDKLRHAAQLGIAFEAIFPF
ncbi:MAG: nuclear transport factor 2 family protein [Pseudomonadota bacterium]